VDAAKRYRVDVENVEKAVAAGFAAKSAKQPKSKTKSKTKTKSKSKSKPRSRPKSVACRQSSDAGVEGISFWF